MLGHRNVDFISLDVEIVSPDELDRALVEVGGLDGDTVRGDVRLSLLLEREQIIESHPPNEYIESFHATNGFADCDAVGANGSVSRGGSTVDDIKPTSR